MTTDCNGRYVYLDPQVGGAIAVAEAARNIVCSGGLPLAITDNLNFGSPEKPEIFWQLEKSADGITEACLALDTPVIGGNVSLYNENAKGAIYPTPVIGMVGLIEDIDHITTQGFKNVGDVVFLLGETHAELGGSELQKAWYGVTEGRPPRLDLAAERRLQQALLAAIKQGLVASAHDCAEGGAAVALAEACISGQRSVQADLTGTLRADHALFSESQSRVVVSAAPADEAALAALLAAQGVPFQVVGTVTDAAAPFTVSVNGAAAISLPLTDLENTWKDAIPCLMR
jgi:phosphoribosylformylglycinamidine synthase